MLKNPDWSDIFAPRGTFLQEGEIIQRTNLSRTLQTIADEGADALYKVGYPTSSFERLIRLLPGPNCTVHNSQDTKHWRRHDFRRPR